MALFKFNIEQKFGYILECLDTYEVNNLSNVDLSSYDVIFTTVQFYLPINDENVPTIIYVDSFQTIRDLKKEFLETNKKVDIRKYFKEELFFNDLEASSAGEVIKKMTDEIKKTIDLPDDFEKDLLLREEITKTTYEGIIAYPHTENTKIKESFISVAVLKTPIYWNNTKIQIVILGGYTIENLRNKMIISDIISYLITNSYYGKALCQNPSYKTLIKLLDSVYK